MAAAVADRMAVEVVGAALARMSLAAGTAVAVTGMVTAVAVTGMVMAGIALALVGMAVEVTGTAAAGMVVVTAGITAVTVAVGELDPQSVSVLALDYSGERWRPLPITVAMITATITRRMPVHPHLRFGIGAMRIKTITLRSPNARFLGDKLFSNL